MLGIYIKRKQGIEGEQEEKVYMEMTMETNNRKSSKWKYYEVEIKSGIGYD